MFNDVTTFHWPHCFMSEGYSQPLVDPFVSWCQQYHLRYWHRSVSEIGQWYSGVNHSTLPLSIFFAPIFGFFSFCSIRRPTVVSGLMNFSAVLRFCVIFSYGFAVSIWPQRFTSYEWISKSDLLFFFQINLFSLEATARYFKKFDGVIPTRRKANYSCVFRSQK